jgi:hypothetical protein
MSLYKLNHHMPSATIAEYEYIPVTAVFRDDNGNIQCSTWLDFGNDTFGQFDWVSGYFGGDQYSEWSGSGIYCDWIIPEMERSTLLTTSHTFVEDPSRIDKNPIFDFRVSAKKPKGVDYIQIFESSRGVYGVKRNAEGLIHNGWDYVSYSRLKLRRGNCNKYYLYY